MTTAAPTTKSVLNESRQIERAVIEFDDMAFADQPVKVGGERQFPFLIAPGFHPFLVG